MSRTTRLAAVLVVAVIAVSAGCVGVLTGNQPLTFDAQPVSVSAAAQHAAGYDHVNTTTQTLSRSFSVAGQSRKVTVTNHLAEYGRTVSLGSFGSADLARFVVVSTPAVQVLGQTFNPVGHMSSQQLVEQVQGKYQGVSNVQPAGNRTRTLLGTSTTVSSFTADATFGGSGQSISLTIDVAKVRDGGDYVVVVAVYPTKLPGEADRVDTMLTGVQHASG